MRKLSKKKVTEEFVFEADDGQLFAYEGQAIEHDINIVEEALEPMNMGEINIPDLNLVGTIYNIRNRADLQVIKKYCELRDFELKDPGLPTKVIVTNEFVVTVDDLKKVVDKIAHL